MAIHGIKILKIKAMKKFILPAIILVSLSILTSCSALKMPVSSHIPENNKNYEVDFLFEYDGCRVYRFFDRGNYVYFTRCEGEVSSIVNDSTVIRTVTKTINKNQLNTISY